MPDPAIVLTPFTPETLSAQLVAMAARGVSKAVFLERRWAHAMRPTLEGGRFVATLEDWLNGVSTGLPCLAPHDDRGVYVALSVIRSTEPQEPWLGVWRFGGFRRRLARLLLEMWDAGWTSSHLSRASLALDGRLANKCACLSSLLASLDSRLASLGFRPRSLAAQTALESALTASPVGLFVSGEILGWQREWLTQLMESQRHLHWVGESNADYPGAFAGVTSLFLREPRSGTDSHPIHPSAVRREVLTGSNPYEEVEAALIRLSQLSGENEPSGAALFTHDLKLYGPLVATAGQRLGIAVQTSIPGPLREVPLIEAWFEAVQSCIDGQAELLGLTDTSEPSPNPEVWRRETGSRLGWSEWKQQVQALWDASAFSRRAFGARNAAAVQAMFSIVDGLATIFDPAIALTSEEFIQAWRADAEDAEFSYLHGEQGTRLVSDVAEIGPVEGLIVLGSVDGVFPPRRSENPVFNDDDRRMVWEVQPSQAQLSDSVSVQVAASDLLYRLLALPKQWVVLSYPANKLDGENTPAQIILETQAQESPVLLAGDLQNNLGFKGTQNLAVAECLQMPVEPLARETLEPGSRAPVSLQPGELVRPDAVRAMYACPFQFGASRLRLRPSWKGLLGPRLSLVARDSGLAQARTEDEAKVLLKAAFEQELESIAGALTEEQLGLARSWASRLVREWAAQEFAAREQWGRKGIQPPESVELDVSKALSQPEGETRIGFRADAVHAVGPYRFAKVYGARTEVTDLRKFDIESPASIWVWSHLLAMRDGNSVPGVEFCDNQNGRLLVVLDRDPNQALRSTPGQDRVVLNMNNAENKGLSQFRGVFAETVDRLRSNDMAITPSELSCRTCDLAELCRKLAHGDQAEEAI